MCGCSVERPIGQHCQPVGWSTRVSSGVIRGTGRCADFRTLQHPSPEQPRLHVVGGTSRVAIVRRADLYPKAPPTSNAPCCAIPWGFLRKARLSGSCSWVVLFREDDVFVMDPGMSYQSLLETEGLKGGFLDPQSTERRADPGEKEGCYKKVGL